MSQIMKKMLKWIKRIVYINIMSIRIVIFTKNLFLQIIGLVGIINSIEPDVEEM